LIIFLPIRRSVGYITIHLMENYLAAGHATSSDAKIEVQMSAPSSFVGSGSISACICEDLKLWQ
jgi:pyridoxal biosynthesis lyase PdxS